MISQPNGNMYHMGNLYPQPRRSLNQGYSVTINHEYTGPSEHGIPTLPLGEKMFNQKGTIFHFHLSRSQNAWDVVVGMCIYIKGLWQGVIDDSEFNNFFMDTVPDCAKDTWWDPSQKCEVMLADEEMASILQMDKDLIFANKPVIVNVPGRAPLKQSKKGGTDLLSTGSASTFQTTGTTQTHSPWKPKTKVKLLLLASTASSGSETTFSTSTFSEKDISYLLEHIIAAMNINQTNNMQNTAMLPAAIGLGKQHKFATHQHVTPKHDPVPMATKASRVFTYYIIHHSTSDNHTHTTTPTYDISHENINIRTNDSKNNKKDKHHKTNTSLVAQQLTQAKDIQGDVMTYKKPSTI